MFYNNYKLSQYFLRIKGYIERTFKVNELYKPNTIPSNLNHNNRLYKPIVIVGCGRSGTTLLFNLLNEHANLISTRGFPDGEDTEMWVKVAGALLAGFGGSRSKTAVGHSFCLPMGGDDISDDRVHYVHNFLLKKYSKLRNKKYRLLNKNPHLSNKIGLINKIFPDAKLIHIIRNPYEMIASWKQIIKQFKHIVIEIPDNIDGCINVYPNSGWNNMQYMSLLELHNKNIYNQNNERSVGLLARYWVNTNNYITDQVNKMRNLNYHLIKYDDLLKNRDQELKKIVQFCELSKKDSWKIAIKGEIKDKWKNILSKKEIEIISCEIHNQSEKYGYNLNQGI